MEVIEDLICLNRPDSPIDMRSCMGLAANQKRGFYEKYFQETIEQI